MDRLMVSYRGCPWSPAWMWRKTRRGRRSTGRELLSIVVVPLIICWLAVGCVTSQPPAPKDPFFEGWKARAEDSRGHSPPAPERAPATIPPVPAARKIPTSEAPPVPDKPLPSQKVSLRMHDADVVVVLRALARAVNQGILINERVKGTVSVDIEGVPWDQAFSGILRLQGLHYAREGDLIRVMTLEDMEHDLKMSAIQEKRKAQKIDLKLVDPLVTRIIPVHYSDARKLRENLKEFLTRDEKGNVRGSIMVDEHTNSLIVNTIQDDVDQILALVRDLDRPTAQILIEANIVEATREVARHLGIEWGSSVSEGDFTASPGVSFPVRDAALAAAGGSGTLGLMFGSLDGNFLDMTLTALQQEGKLNILSSPSITTLDNQMAFTENGEKVPYVTVDENGNREVRFEDAVLRLEITPHVVADKHLKLKIVVKKDEVDFTRDVDGNPVIIKKQTETTLFNRSGETIVISGLSKQRSNEVSRGVPGLKDTPLLGWLFSADSRDASMQEVLIFITPHILQDRTLSEVRERAR